jgi:tRNA pseudouridine13 synthase
MIIKRYPEDFSVEEMLTTDAAKGISSEPSSHVLYRLTKRGLGTDEALERAARVLRVPVGRISYVGLKDKHALTVQYVSVKNAWGRAGKSPRALRTIGPASIKRARWSLERVGWFDRHLEPTDVAGNRFRITIRNLTRRQCALIEETADLLAATPGARRALRFPNYFGEQRFGSARHGRGFAARRLIEGDFDGALKLIHAARGRRDSRGGGELVGTFDALPGFIQRMAIEAYQSWLWNEVARRVVAEQCAGDVLEIPTRFGPLLFPRAASVPAGLVGLVIPLLSPGTTLADAWKTAALEVLGEEGLTLSKLRVPGRRRPYFGGTPRALFAEATEFSLGPFEHDESLEDRRRFKRRLKFLLPRGAYGTVLLRALGRGAQNTLT